MRTLATSSRLLLPVTIASLSCLTGCAAQSTFVHADATLGRVVVYRNGIAYFERTAHVEGDALRLAVPVDKVNDFLKSLTVVDAKTGEPAPVAYPTTIPSSESGLIDMKIGLTGPASHDLRLTYVTEAPAWKPSYRVVLGKDKKVSVQAWAIVDNTSGEDWQNVRLGVGSSSALSFRFDLQSVKPVSREELRATDVFAQAPPMGGATYAQNAEAKQPALQNRVVYDVSDDKLAQTESEEMLGGDRRGGGPRDGVALNKAVATHGGVGASAGKAYRPAPSSGRMAPAAAAPPPVVRPQAPTAVDEMAKKVKSSSAQFIIEGYADAKDADRQTAALERANRTRELLIQRGVSPSQVVAVANGQRAGRGGIALVEAAAVEKPKNEPGSKEGEASPASEPIGTSHFESPSRMTVARGTSAMVSILSKETEGEVVYLYDAESPRGNSTFPFRAVHIKNPTDSVLESGPVTVFGEGKFIGEGMSDPIPAFSSAFVPFALDRQIVVEHKDDEADRIARILSVQRGVFSTEVQHTRRATLTVTNRMAEPATVYVRHTVAQGYHLTKAPKDQERLGAAYLFRVDLVASGKAEVVIEESTPVLRTTDIRTNVGMEMVQVYLSSEAVEGPLKKAVSELVRLQKEMGNTEQQISTIREAMQEYRTRMDELHAQIVTLKVVRTAGPLMQSLEKKMAEISDKLSKATLDVVALQEKLMVARIKFQDAVSELSLEKPAGATRS